jgi:hypothetical protein
VDWQGQQPRKWVSLVVSTKYKCCLLIYTVFSSNTGQQPPIVWYLKIVSFVP